MEARALALQLLTERTEIIGRVAFRLAKRLDPRMSTLPEDVAAASIATTMRALESFLRTGDPTPVVTAIESVAALRSLIGWSEAHFLVMGNAYLPALRKVFLRYAPDPARGLAAYDVVESAALPLVVRLMQQLQAGTLQRPDATAEFRLPHTEPGDATNPFRSVSLDDITAEL